MRSKQTNKQKNTKTIQKTNKRNLSPGERCDLFTTRTDKVATIKETKLQKIHLKQQQQTNNCFYEIGEKVTDTNTHIQTKTKT